MRCIIFSMQQHTVLKDQHAICKKVYYGSVAHQSRRRDENEVQESEQPAWGWIIASVVALLDVFNRISRTVSDPTQLSNLSVSWFLVHVSDQPECSLTLPSIISLANNKTICWAGPGWGWCCQEKWCCNLYPSIIKPSRSPSDLCWKWHWSLKTWFLGFNLGWSYWRNKAGITIAAFIAILLKACAFV